MGISNCINDDSIGPTVQGCRDDFDFTFKFEWVFLSLLPSAVFIALSLPRVYFLARRPVIASGTWFQLVKSAAIAFHAALQLCMLIVSSLQFDRLRVLNISAVSSTFVASLALVALSALEHSRAPRPSILINTYLLLTTLFDAAICRTLWLVVDGLVDETYARLATIALVSKVVLIILESHRKAKWLHWNVQEHSPEETSGIYRIGAYAWLNQLFMAGYRKVITMADLYPLDSSLRSEALYATLDRTWNTRQHPSEDNALAKTLFKTFMVSFFLPVAPRIAMGAFRLCQPFLIETVLDYIRQPSDERSPNIGYGLIAATLLVYVGVALSEAAHQYFIERAIYSIRGGVASLIYQKTIESKIAAADDSAALTLMSADVERLKIGMAVIHEFWASPLQIAIASWLLQQQLGASFASILGLNIVCFGAAFVNGNMSGRRQRIWMASIQRRIGLTTHAINHMKTFKMSGLAAPVERLVQNLRLAELAASAGFRMHGIATICLGYMPQVMGSVLVFAITDRHLDTTTVFTSMAYLVLVTAPMSEIAMAFPAATTVLACLGRIQKFLENDSRVDFRSLEDGGPTKDGETGNSEPLIRVSSGQFGWDATEPAVLKDINVEIPSSKLTMVVGPVASGKSTLCKALLGESPVVQGQTWIAAGSRRIGFCDQVPFMTNSTIRSNILGFSPFDATRYQEVIEATMLVPDLASLPKGDMTRVGSNGIQLSGGQKQRVSIARALYLGTETLIFDDVLSGLDADTEEEVFLRVFGPEGLVRRRGATAVLCTHSVRHLPMADHVIALGANGTIIEQGSFRQLLENKSYIHGLGVSERSGKKHASSSSTSSPVPAEWQEEGQALAASTTADNTPGDVTEASHIDKNSRKSGEKGLYRHYASSLGRWWMFKFVASGAMVGFLNNWPSIWLQYTTADLGSASPKHTRTFYIGLLGAFQVVQLFFIFLAVHTVVIVMITKAGSKLHETTLRTVVAAPLSFFTKTDVGIVTNLFGQDMAILDSEMPNAVINVAFLGWVCLGMVAVMATSSPYMIAAYVPIAAVLYLIQSFYLKTSRQVRLLDIEARAPLYTHYLDTIRGLATFRAFGWARKAVDVNAGLIDESQRPAYLLSMIQHWLAFTLAMVTSCLAVIIVALAILVPSGGSTSVGFTGASLVTVMTFGETLGWIIRFYTMLETSIGAVSRLRAFSQKVKPEDQEGEDFIPPPQWPERGSIEIRGISASYESKEEEQGQDPNSPNAANEKIPSLALKDINISIQPGQKVAICGRSGSGKSSTILLLLRLLDPCGGSIEMDGTPLSIVDRATLRQRLITVPQEAVFLPDGSTFRENLDPFGAAAPEDCEAVLAAVGLWEFVAQRGGLAGEMSGDSLSQGQKQLFSLARAVLRRKLRSNEAGEKSAAGGILLLDEVSSSVDMETDRTMQAVIRREFEGYTIVAVSHRLEMVVSDFDVVVVMERGAVMETGSPRELLEREGGSRFRDLWAVGKE